jgi:hypothetical protein
LRPIEAGTWRLGLRPRRSCRVCSGYAEAMIWKLLCVSEKSWRKLDAPLLMREVCDGKRFKDGIAMPIKTEPTRKPPKSFYTPTDKTSVPSQKIS